MNTGNNNSVNSSINSTVNTNLNNSLNTSNGNEKKRVSSPPVTNYHQTSSMQSIIIEDDDGYADHSYGYDTPVVGASQPTHVMINDEEDIIQLNDDENDDVIIIDPNA